MKSVLVTGFQPFGGDSSNPSEAVAEALNGRLIEGRTVVGTVLPVEFGGSIAALKKHLSAVQPELVVCLGQAGGRSAISLERVAINVDDAKIPDNRGEQPVDRPIVARAPTAYWSSLPIKAMVLALRAAGLPAEVSQSAGTFVCNHVFYGLMHELAKMDGRGRTRGRRTRGGFVHLPFSTEQAQRIGRGAPSLPVPEMTRGVELAISTALHTQKDTRASGGALD